MNSTCGVIILDVNEIILRIYHLETPDIITLLRCDTYDFAIEEPGLVITAAQIIELITTISLSDYGQSINEWRICARNLPEEIIREVTPATGIFTEDLTLVREQELIAKGLLMELQQK